MSDTTKKIGSVEDLTPDDKNANKGTPRGRALLESSIERYGAGRGVVADKRGKIIAGNKTVEVAAEKGLPVRVVETDGRELVVVQRTDLDMDVDIAARELAIADNRAAELDLAWDKEQLAELEDLGVSIEQFNFNMPDDDESGGDAESLPRATQMVPDREYVVVFCEDEEDWVELRARLGLGFVRRGGYAESSTFNQVGIQRVLKAKELFALLAANPEIDDALAKAREAQQDATEES